MITFSQHIEESLYKPSQLNAARKTLLPFNGIEQYFPKSTIRRLGSGSYGTVYSLKDKNYVLKVFDQKDYGYKSWLLFCLRNQHNSFVPKIIGKPVPLNNAVAVVRLEPLTDIRGNAFRDLYSWWRKYRGLMSFMKTDDAKKASSPKDLHASALVLKADWPSLQPVNDFIKAMSYIDNHSVNDIRESNFLMRPNGQLVLTDPLAWEGSDNLYKKIGSKHQDLLLQFLNSRHQLDKDVQDKWNAMDNFDWD